MDHLAIIAGGKGTRLGASAAELAKALVPVGGKPVLQHQLESAAAAGIRKATIFAGHKADQIAQFVGDGARFGLSVKLVVEDAPLGNAGGLLGSLDLLPEHFLVLYGDIMLAVDLQAIARRHLERCADFTTLVHPNDHPLDSDLIEAGPDDWVRAVRPYPHAPGTYYGNLVNAALYVARRDALRPFVTVGKCDFTRDLMPALIARGGRVLAYRSSEYIKDMGTPERLAGVERDFAEGRLARDPRPSAAVFLDRDGTLNLDPGFLADAEALELLPGAGAALRRLREGGYRLVVVTNQPVIARGEASEEDVAAIHRRLEWELGIEGGFVDAIYLCPHHPHSGFAGERPELKGPCECRKPGTALIDRACLEHRLDPSRSWMIGDRTADIELARRAGLRSILVRTGSAGRDGEYAISPDHVADDIDAAADLILAQGAR